MKPKSLIDIINYIVSKSSELKDRYTDQKSAPVEFACIFCQNENEYQQFSKTIKTMGEVVQDTPSGYTYQLHHALPTLAGPLRLVKIRKPDPRRPERGDADFNTDYPRFKENYLNKSHFELIERGEFEMLRISDPDFDVLTCFYSIPLGMLLGFNKK